MQQVIVIHGGTTYADHESYLKSLSEKKVDLDRLLYRSKWKEGLQAKLGNEYQVLLPSMPNSTNARYSEWKLWFENISSVFTDDCILIGHSLGAVFLAKYLSEHKLPVTIRSTILIAAPYDDERAESLADFKITQLTELLITQSGKLVFINGIDDPVISVADLDKYKQALPSADFITLPAADHFVREEFPELVTLIKRAVRS